MSWATLLFSFSGRFNRARYWGLAIGVKRLHDRDKSGWWILIFYVTPLLLDGIAEWIEGWPVGVLRPANLAISVWALIELGIRRGTRGPNRFGDDPLGERSAGAPTTAG